MVVEGWKIVNIGQDCTLKARIGWQGLTVQEYKDNGNYFLVTGTDFDNGFVDWDTCHYVDKWRYTQDKNIQLKTGDVLITKDGTIGKVGYIENLRLPATLNSGVFVVRSKKDDMFPKYLYYIFTSKIFESFLNRLTAGSTINHLYQKDFVSFDFNIPELSEQKAIATALSDVDELITTLTTLIAKKEDIKTATMQQLLTGKKQLDGFSGEWVEETIGDFGVFKSGSGFPTRFQGDIKNKIPFYKVSDMNNKGNSIAMIRSNNYISENVRKIINATILPKNSIVFAKIGAAIFLERKKVLTIDSCIDNNMMAYIVNEEIAEFKYFHYLFLNIEFGKLVSATALPSLSGKDIAKLKFLFPQKDEQKAIAQIISDMDKELETLKTKLEKTKALKTGMMQELLTGKTRLLKKVS